MEHELLNYFTVLRNFGRIYSRRLIDGSPRVSSDLKLSQLRALYAFRDSDRLSMKELARNIGVKLPSMTMMIDSLERDGFVQRMHDEHDRRKVIVRLTGKGKKLRREFLTKRRKIARDLFDRLSERDRRRLLASLGTVCQVLEKAFGEEEQ